MEELDMYARVGVSMVHRSNLDDGMVRQSREQTLAVLRQRPGFAGLHILADRETGTTLAFSFWETEAALRAWSRCEDPLSPTRSDHRPNRAGGWQLRGRVQFRGPLHAHRTQHRYCPLSAGAALGDRYVRERRFV